MSRKEYTLIPATATPLASIFGSGFLIIVPIVGGTIQHHSTLAMLIICAFAYAVGSVIRYNIKYAEPILFGKPKEITLSLEKGSDFALNVAYVISVCLYLRILSSFVLGGLQIDSNFGECLLTTGIISLITVVGMTKGLKMLENLEKWALIVTFLIIFTIIFGFAFYDLNLLEAGKKFKFSYSTEKTPWEVLTILAGTLICVQGFETPRYLANIYDSETRIQASRLSQVISSIIYVIFMTLSIPLLPILHGEYNDNSLIDLVSVISVYLVAPLVIAATLSQFSAAVADTITAAENMEEMTHQTLKARWAYLLIGFGAITLTWWADTFEIVAIASKAFAFYYFMQCLVAISIAKSRYHQLGIAFIALALAFITIFAIPAS